MSKRMAARTRVTPEAAALVRQAFEPRYGRALDDVAVEGIADRFRRFTEVLVLWETEDRARQQGSAAPEGTCKAGTAPRVRSA